MDNLSTYWQQTDAVGRTVAAILESYGVDAQAALAGLIHGQ